MFVSNFLLIPDYRTYSAFVTNTTAKYEGHLESSYHDVITPQCVDKMLFLETRIQGLLNGLIFVEKGLGVHVQHMLKMSRVYTLAVILSKILVKNEGKMGSLFTIMV